MSLNSYGNECAYDHSSVAATIVVAEDGGSIRTISGRGMRRPHGRFPSKKVRRTMPFDAMHERDLLWICEADPRVETYLTQPHRLEIRIQSSSRPLIYFPDLMRRLDNGMIEIVETKKTLAEVSSDPAYEVKLDLARQIYEMEGWRFLVLDQDTIRRQPRLGNARLIAGDRHTRTSTTDIMKVQQRAEFDGFCYGSAIAALSATDNPFDPLARAKLHALIVKRFVSIDIEKSLGLSTPIHLGAASTADHRRLRLPH